MFACRESDEVGIEHLKEQESMHVYALFSMP